MLLNEFFFKKLNEGGNLAIGQDQADQINLQVTNRSVIVPILNDLLLNINNTFAKRYKTPLWSPDLLQKQTFLSGSSLHFFNVKGISDEEFVAKKPKVGDIDTMVAKDLEGSLDEFLTSNQGKMFGTAKLIGHQRGNEQFSSLFELQDPPIKVQIDLEFVAQDKNGPTDWARFSHSSSWEDIKEGVKGVFHKFLIQSFSVLSQKDFLLRKKVGRGKAATEQDIPTTDNLVSFAVSSKEGGGLRAKYEPINDEAGNPLVIDGLPVMRALPAEGYKQDIGEIFATLFGDRIDPKSLKKMDKQLWSFTGLLQVANTILSPEEKAAVADQFIEKLFAKGAQGLYKNDPERDLAEKNVAVNLMFNTLKVAKPAGLDQLQQTYKNNYRVTSESFLREADEKPAVKAQLRKGMPHLHDLKAVDFLDLLDEIHDGNGNFKLENIPLNVKVDGFGGRFGKNAEGQPFMGTSRTEPRYEASFVKYHQQKGTTDPEILGRAQMFDNLFNEMMNAIKLVDSKLGPDFLINKQVTCEVLFLPFATQTPEGKLKFVGIHYDALPEGVQLALVPFHAVEADTGEPVQDHKFIDNLLSLGKQGSVMFINNRLTQKEGLDVTEIINVLDNIEELKQIVSDTAGKRDRASLQLRKEVEEKLAPVKDQLEQAIINDPNILGKDMLGKDYEGIVINSRLGPIKITSQEQRDVISAKLDAKKNARTERPRDNQNKTAVVAIGSFVGHKGHQELWNFTQQEAQAVGGDPYLFIGNAEGKDDPIPVADKVKTWHQLYPQFTGNISAVTHEGGSIMQKIKHELINPLPGKPPRYDNIIIMVGEDRKDLPMGKALMKAVNKFPGYEHVKVELKVTPRGQGVSGTALRNTLKTGNPEQAFQFWNDTFNSGNFGAQKLSPEWIQHLMDVTKKGMGITDAPKPVAQPQQPQPQKFKPAPKSAAEVPVPTQTEVPMKTAESILREMMIVRAEIAWQRELMEEASQMAAPSGPEYDKTGGHHRLSETLLDPQKRRQIIQFLAKKMDWEVNYLELASDPELISWYKKVIAGKKPLGETKRMSNAVKLQRAWEREQAKSSASRERGNNILNPKKAGETPKPVGAGSGKVKMSEFAPPGGGDDGFDDDMLKRLAAQWYNGDEDPRVEQTLAAAGWEIGQDEGYEDEPGVFVVMSGDDNGRSYMSWPADELRNLSETALKGKDDLAAKRKALQDMEREPGHDKEAIRQRKLDLEKEAKAKGVAEGSNVDSQIKRIKDRILQLKDWNTAGTHDKKIKELQARLKELQSQKQGVAEAMLPKSTFTGSNKNKLGRAGQLMGKDKRPAKAGDFVGGESYKKKKGNDGKACWDNYKYAGSKNGKDKCVPVGEDVENLMAGFIKLLESKK